MAKRLALACILVLLPMLCGCGSQTAQNVLPDSSTVRPLTGAPEQLGEDYETPAETAESVANAETPVTKVPVATPNRTTPERERLVEGPDSSVDVQVPAAEQEPTEEPLLSPEQE